MPVRLDNLKRINPRATDERQNPSTVPEHSYVYKDISFDLEFGQLYGNLPVNKPSNDSDLKDLTDLKDLRQSLTNLFNTTPGQRLTNPFFGLNLSTFLFDPISTITADMIGRTIYSGIGQFEPRVSIDRLSVIGYPDDSVYKISFSLLFADDSLGGQKMTGSLTGDGFKFDLQGDL